MTTERRYWLLQYVGWGAYSIVGVALTTILDGFQLSMVVGYLFFFGYSIGFTDFFRQQIKCRGWLDLPFGERFLRLIAGSILIGTLQTALVVLIDAGFNREFWPYSEVGWLWGSVTNAMFAWTFMYV